jgi:PAS domain S-box-containing protein
MHSTANDLWRVIVEKAPDAILFADHEGLIRLWNEGAERIFGVSREAALGCSLDLIIPEKLRRRHWDGYYRVMAGGQSRYGTELLRVPALKGDGGQFSSEFSIVMVRDDAGKALGVAAILRDVSAQWQRERELKARLEELSRGGEHY